MSQLDNYDPSRVLQINKRNGLRDYQCVICKKIHKDPIEAGSCCQDEVF